MAVLSRETRDCIETELRVGQRQRVIQRLLALMRDFDELEAQLQAREKEAGLPVFYRSKPLTERMAHLGMTQQAIDGVAARLDAIEKLLPGQAHDLPAVRKELADSQHRTLCGDNQDERAASIRMRNAPGAG